MSNQQPKCQMDYIVDSINKPAKLVQCIMAHNEEEFIEYTLKSIYSEVDRIIVVEGAVENRANQTADGHSIDKTMEIVRQFKKEKDVDRKITPIQIRRPWKSLEEMKQTFFDMCCDNDIIIINDADEIYKPEDIKRVRTLFDREPYASEVVPMFLHFYRDFGHIQAPDNEWQPLHQRIFRYQRGMKYNSHPVATDPWGRCTYFDPAYQHRRFTMNNFFIWHYGYARSGMDEIMKSKQIYYEKELKKLNATKQFDKKVSEFLNKIENLNLIGQYPLDLHPEVMKTHPMFSYSDSFYKDKSFTSWSEFSPYKEMLTGKEYGLNWLWMRQPNPRQAFYHHEAVV